MSGRSKHRRRREIHALLEPHGIADSFEMVSRGFSRSVGALADDRLVDPLMLLDGARDATGNSEGVISKAPPECLRLD